MNGVHDEERILADLRRVAARVDPVPPVVIENARAALGLHRLDAELLDLVRDSADEGAELVTVRGDTDVRMVSFEFPPVTVEVQVTETSGWCDLVAHVSGIDLADARVETGSDRRELDTDDGTLVVEGIPNGLVRLHLGAADGRRFATSWLRV
jgi:hypothetical protein